jgi:hypothetical protein
MHPPLRRPLRCVHWPATADEHCGMSVLWLCCTCVMYLFACTCLSRCMLHVWYAAFSSQAASLYCLSADANFSSQLKRSYSGWRDQLRVCVCLLRGSARGIVRFPYCSRSPYWKTYAYPHSAYVFQYDLHDCVVQRTLPSCVLHGSLALGPLCSVRRLCSLYPVSFTECPLPSHTPYTACVVRRVAWATSVSVMPVASASAARV